MPHIVNKRNENRVKLYRKVRFTSSWGTILTFLILSLIFSLMTIFLMGFIFQYIFESKFAGGLRRLEYIAELYDSCGESESFDDYISSLNEDFFIKDDSGKVIFSHGDITCGSEGTIVFLADGDETYRVYQDTENGLLYPTKKGRISFDLGSVLDFCSEVRADTDDDILFPIWVDIRSDEDSENTLVGKAYLTLNKRDSILILELTLGVILVSILIFFIMLVHMISSMISYYRVVRLFYSDPVTLGHNWIWYVRYGDEKLQSFISRKNSYAVVNLVFVNYRNYCLCHSISEGDSILANMDKVLSGKIRKTELCAHASRAEFALLLNYDDEAALKTRLEDIVRSLQSMDTEHNFEFRVGVDLVPVVQNDSGKFIRRKGCSIEKAYIDACSAVGRLEEKEELGIRFFDNALLEEKKWEDTVNERQNAALKNEEFKVYYQPKYDPNTGRMRGAEALIRWITPENELISPVRFIPIFEKNGFITQIDHFMLRHVSTDQKRWLDEGYDCVPVSVNVSRAHFSENDLAEQIRDIVDEAECPHDLIEIELTESAFFDDKTAMIDTIRKLKEYGFAVSMDDFGSGYSSLNSLKDMPLDVLKLDAEFFRGEGEGERGKKVVSEAIKLAKILEMRTVAEGVEEKEQVDFLAELGCDMIQGFFFAKPMEKGEYEKRMTRQPEGTDENNE